MKRIIPYIILGVVIVAIVASAITWWSQQAAPLEEEEIRSAVVGRGAVRVAVSTNGAVEPQSRVKLAFEAPGRVAEVLVEMGDTVKAGDVLARLDSEHLALQVRQAEAAMAAAKAQLAQIEAGARPGEIAAAEANLRAVESQADAASANLAQLWAGASDAQIAAAQAQVASALIQQRDAEDMHDLTMTCVTINLPQGMGEKEICPALGPYEEQARYGLNVADKALAAARMSLDEMLAGADADEVRAAQANVSTVEAQRDAVQAQLDLLLAGAPQDQVTAVTALVAQAQAALELAELMLARATLYAPSDGVVAAVNVTEGQIMGGGMPAITLVDNSRFYVTVEVDEVDVVELAEGQAVEVTLDALPDVVLKGAVERIAPAAAGLPSLAAGGMASMGATGLSLASLSSSMGSPGVVSYDMTITLNETDAPVRPGMSADAVVMVREVTDALLIPNWVVRIDHDTGQTYVQRQVGEQYERVDVELGVRGHGVVQVLDGLAEGDEVVLIQESVVEAIREARQ